MAASEPARFGEHRYLSLATFRPNGEVVATPVWFAADGDVVYVRTFARTGKLRRLRRCDRVRVAPCDRRGGVTGRWFDTEARIVGGDEARRANRLLDRKYGVGKRLADLWYQTRLGPIVVVAIRVGQPDARGDVG